MNLLKKCLIRGVIPLIILGTASIWHAFLGSSAEANNTFVLALITFFLGLTSVLYEVQQWKWGKQILIHYLVMLVTVYPTLLLSGMYAVHSFRDALKVFFHFNQVELMLFIVTFLFSVWREKRYMRKYKEYGS
ncbi:DUF3021 family protein [Bacillus sp. KH172YL63]|uniref:DUF3021 family protein n=1 Tax=Bacillus sp. KH172YL63 TaxID=2709784 RepID=UPI0013E4BAA8|nr:DUF3021 family protein [Bacillus sp. KH172YL63]BCB04042.1 hypothetical protein KH172YL63_21750 [Bacillus sp. KH172YL63]